MERNNPAPGFSPKTQFGYLKTHTGYPKMCDQAALVAHEFERLGFSVVRLSTVDDAPTLFAVYGDTELAIIVNEPGEPKTEAQREWASDQSTTVTWCSDYRHARDIAKAARRQS